MSNGIARIADLVLVGIVTGSAFEISEKKLIHAGVATQLTMMFVTLAAETAPLGFVTVQLYPSGWDPIDTLYVVPVITALLKANVPLGVATLSAPFVKVTETPVGNP